MISVVIPAFRQAHLLPQAIESVQHQTVSDWEIIVACGDRECADIAHGVAMLDHGNRITVLEDLTRGNADARNRAIERASGRFIVPLDADDMLAPNYMERTLSETKPGLNIVSTHMQKFGDDTGVWAIAPFDRDALATDNCLCVTSLYDRELWRRVGGYEDSLVGYEDWDFWLRCAELRPSVAVIPETLFFYRRHEGNDSVKCGRYQDLVAMIHALHPHIYGTLTTEELVRMKNLPPSTRERLLKRRQWFPENKNLQLFFELAGMTMDDDHHLGGCSLDTPDPYTWMPDVWDRLISDYHIESVLDLGCGAGWVAAWFAKRIPRVLGIEGWPDAIAARRIDPMVAHDFTLSAWKPLATYDLGWCSEFVEHIEPAFMPNWMASLKKCRYVCMTFATPGQGGYHHVNEQPESYWVGRFDEYGFDHVPEETAKLRATANGEPWGRRTLTFFKNREQL